MNNPLPQRRTIRLQGYDYSQEGLYFVTICCQDKICRFGKIQNDEVVLNEVGEIVKRYWLDIPNHFPHIILHEFVIMPNHVHGILEIAECVAVAANNHSPENETPFRSPSKTIGSVVRGFKIGVSKWLNNQWAKDFSPVRQLSKSIWQRNYYEHIIRNSRSYQNISDYIKSNPINWIQDDYYSELE
ncbi:transposase [Dysgonomonas sp. OttesenSCG-928-M03]|nr:transposase [Dysgonomonas sp. OttesenSCG-928-M03]